MIVTINNKVRHAGLREGNIANLALGLAVRHESLLAPDWLTVERCDVPLHAQAGAIWLRLPAQAYNEPADNEKLAEIVALVLREHG
jgi:hypothetical protein